MTKKLWKYFYWTPQTPRCTWSSVATKIMTSDSESRATVNWSDARVSQTNRGNEGPPGAPEDLF